MEPYRNRYHAGGLPRQFPLRKQIVWCYCWTGDCLCRLWSRWKIHTDRVQIVYEFFLILCFWLSFYLNGSVAASCCSTYVGSYVFQQQEMYISVRSATVHSKCGGVSSYRLPTVDRPTTYSILTLLKRLLRGEWPFNNVSLNTQLVSKASWFSPSLS